MKNLRTAVLCVCTMITGFCASAQNPNNLAGLPINEPNLNKPKLFQGQPESIPVSLENLDNLFGKQVGQSVNVTSAGLTPFQFSGQVISTVTKYNSSMQSLVIRSTNFTGSSFTVSKVKNEDGTIVYRGRIMSLQHGDVYELQFRDGAYALVKRNFYDIVAE